ncbi:tRNA 2-thiouridine(34) synthase MnmA [Desulfogranum mediterraneum]|uniref:tRNA 2-thiouridine(34) synthase MnmA n=1 Tax=Desulfogranum mediterraneum TaxID=160661 RepID=UPI000A01A16E|nr:tRNA 2-thiouridine(34) synthase MnmA [Desulfogranum mediterraneum]
MGTQTTIGMAMSGGVDSTVAALLLKEQGYRVHGFFMLLPVPELSQQQERVAAVARLLDIPLTLIDLRKAFTATVIHSFIKAYRRGLTPNPCICCNQEIKLGLFMEQLLARGMSKVATGHYARLHKSGNQNLLRRSPDPRKDQSYFLCRLAERQRARLLLPLAGWNKQDTYTRARALGMDFPESQESQDVCFLPRDLPSFLLSQGLSPLAGEIVAPDGSCLGPHQGIWNYTIGQRRGLGIPDATPWYVIGLDARRNRVLVGKEEQLFSSSLRVHGLQWHRRPALFPWQGTVQLRSRHRSARGKLLPLGRGRAQVWFDQPQRAITPGQYAAFYEGDKLVGSGIIEGPQPITPTSADSP